jgi:outer membrane immunogenic protein
MNGTLAAATIAALVGVAGAANGAGIYGPSGYGPIGVAPTWSGFYVGAHIGGAWGDLGVNDFDVYGGNFNYADNGVFGGAQLGYNIQRGSLVFGIESDLGYLDPSKGNLNAPYGITGSVNGGFYGDVTGRIGYAFGGHVAAPILLYVKGGWAFYDAGLTITDTLYPSGVTKSGIEGWTIGGGIEYQLSRAWSLKAEYLYYDFGGNTLVAPYDGDRFTTDLTLNTVKLGVNYHLNSCCYAPLK